MRELPSDASNLLTGEAIVAETDPSERISPITVEATLPQTDNTGRSGPSGAAPMHAESILIEEFRHASSVAQQSREDSSRMFNLYLVAAGVLVAGLGVIVQAFTPPSRVQLTLVEAAILLLSGVLSFAFFVKFLDLSQQYREALISMNVIKEFYVRELKKEAINIEDAFVWRLDNIPPRRAIESSTTIIGYVVGLLGSLCFAGATGHVFGLLTFLLHVPVGIVRFQQLTVPFFWQTIVFVVIAALHQVYYSISIRRRSQRLRLSDQLAKFALAKNA